VSIPSLPKHYTQSSSKGKHEINILEKRARETTTPVTRTPVSASGCNKSVFNKEEEDKLKEIVTEYDFNMFMKAKEKAAKMVVRITVVEYIK
jgi:hypothetical protein